MTTTSRTGVTPWPPHTAARYVARGYWTGRTLGERLHVVAVATPDAVCLVDGGERLTYRDLLARADGAALRLRDLGLRPDDRVVLQLPNCWEMVVVLVACLRSGVLPVLAPIGNRRHEIAAVAGHVGARALIGAARADDFDLEEMYREIADSTPAVEHVVVLGDDLRAGSIDLRTLCAPTDTGPAADDNPPALDAPAHTRPGHHTSTNNDPTAGDGAPPFDAPADTAPRVALFLLSSGTTGTPKVIPRTHDDLAYMMRRAAEVCGVDRDSVYLAVLPLGHGFPLLGPGVLGTLLAGGRAVVLGSSAPAKAFDAIEAERVTITSAVPTVIQRWLDHRRAGARQDLSSLRLLQSGAAHLPDAVAGRIGPDLGCDLQQVYGMSEGLLCLTRPDDPAEVVRHTQGRPVSPDDELLVVDPAGEPVPPGELGTLLTRGPYTTRGYYRADELNQQAFVGDGWYRTGDVVRLRPDGNLVVEGRDKDVVNRGGEKIAAAEVEMFAHRLDGVRQAAAVAMPDRDLGEQVCLYLVLRPGRAVELADVRAAMERAGLASFKLPARLVVVDELPVTAVGKPDKRALRADLRQRSTA
ncbi:(2,3-dihydroxybenzoyl)adenylate synthase [Actinosynnema sp. CS-041913]|uniref:(2,3-dihydroxybenzoyl)adenylate synthase n=1 Tax=Actinosynnema sp. CS-041913 TaxID=3239917 RepID=UPI003D93F2A2